jgi:pimeloyl-ACP methyl ester carboxylesterase
MTGHARIATVNFRHGRISLALHQLQAGSGRPLLILHALGEHAPDACPEWADGWTGAVWALDFTGHGESTRPEGGGYTAEALLGDADAALEHLGSATVVGFGIGAYVALMLAGARPTRVFGAVLCDGPGLAGGGVRPGSASVPNPRLARDNGPDPYAVMELARDIRPPDYATNFVRFAFDQSLAAEPIVVAALVRPEWLEAVVDQQGVLTATLESAMQVLRQREAKDL